jgi:hypothetical protein
MKIRLVSRLFLSELLAAALELDMVDNLGEFCLYTAPQLRPLQEGRGSKSPKDSVLEVHMATLPKMPPVRSQEWSAEAMAMAAQAKVLSGNKLEQLVVRLQRHSGRSKEACWRFLIQYGIKGAVDHRRWTVEEVAQKVKRTPNAIRSALRRNHLSVREIRCDLFSLESLASALHVRKAEVVFWIEQGWLPATITDRGKRRSYAITPEALIHLYKQHQLDLLKRGMSNLSLFEAYVQYCYSPKHTVGEQLLDVRRDKRERAAYAVATGDTVAQEDEADGGDEDDLQKQCRVEMAELDALTENPEN